MLEAGMYQGISVKAAEHRKNTENDPKCAGLGAGDVYHWQWRTMGLGTRGTEGLLIARWLLGHPFMVAPPNQRW